MKTIGMIGGMSWESTDVYYKLLNQMTRDRLGGLHSAQMLLWSVDFADIAAMQAADKWDEATRTMISAAQNLERGGADMVLIGANTMHKMADEVAAAVSIPLVHIADATAAAIKASGCQKPLLLATAYTMEQDFYTGRLIKKHGINVATPSDQDRPIVHDIIYNELCRGKFTKESKQAYLSIIQQAVSNGCDGVIFGCTEIGMLIDPADIAPIPAFDTAVIHATAALDLALA